MARKPKAAPATADPAPAPKTGGQSGSGGTAALWAMLTEAAARGTAGWGEAPPPGIRTWRRIVENPTVALARMVALAPVRAALGRAIVRADEGTDLDDAAADLTRKLGPLVGDWSRHAVSGVDYGYAAAEIVWATAPVRLPSGAWLLPTEIKPLLADITEPLRDEKTGRLIGLRNAGVTLTETEMIWFANDPEADNPFGRPRAERVRKIWHAWERCLDRLGQYAAKVAGVTPIVEYPEGETPDERGQARDNFDLAVATIAQLGLGIGVALPNTMARWAADLAQRGVDMKDLRSWNIRFLEPASAHGEEIVSILGGLDRFLLRGYLVPERAATEGTHGTKAEAESHGDLVLAQGDEVAQAMGRAAQRQLIDPIVRANLGDDAVGSLWLVVPAMNDEQASLVRAIVRAALTTPATMETIGGVADYEAMIGSAGVPIRERSGTVPAIPAPEEIDDDDAAPGAALSRLSRRLGTLRIGV